ncbi:MAG TPA: hypothetical protein DCZ75_03205 [Geobacter sp.]|nr:hypothetical protein [Geobacter sp.]
MKRFPGKIVMAAIILSCGFVMQAEQSAENAKSRQPPAPVASREVAFNAPDAARGTKTFVFHSE